MIDKLEQDNWLADQRRKHNAMRRGAIAGWLIWQVIRPCALVAVFLVAMWISNQIF